MSKKKTPPRRRFQIVLPSSQVHAGKLDQRVGALMALARATNAITLARGPLMAPLKNESPAASRERFSGLFYVSAVLYEALRTSEKLDHHFADVEYWNEGIGKLLADPAITDFRNRTLKKFRDKGTFHFDVGFFRKAASRWPSDEIVLATMTSNRIGDIYINASDDLLFSHILGPFDSDDALVAAFSSFTDQTIDLMNRFLQCAHQVIPVVLKSVGAEARRAV